MTKLEALTELARKVEAGEDVKTGYYGVLIVAQFTSIGVSAQFLVQDAFHGSLDAAQALHEALLPGWVWARSPDGLMMVEKYFDTPETDPLFFSAMHRKPARAWLLAILKALIAQEETNT